MFETAKNYFLILGLIVLVSANISQGSSCEDKYQACSNWSELIKWSKICQKTWMKEICQKTCNACPESSCEDKYKECSDWTEWSECNEWMKTNCQKSCKACSGCPDPEPPKFGNWFCTGQSCHLECEPGYAADGRTHTSRGANCGEWTVHPNEMKCSPAVALVIGGLLDTKGAEVYGPSENTEGTKPRCQYRLPFLPDTRVGATLDYVDSFIIACGGSMIKGPPIPPFPPARNTCIAMTPDETWIYHSTMHKGRDVHSSAVNLGKLTLLGGTDAPTSRDTLEPAKSSKWTEEKIKKTKYACTAKLSPTEFMVSGGEYNPGEVLKYNVVTGEITPMANLTQERSGHGCAFVKHKGMVGVMVAGGLPKGNAQWTENVTRATTDHAEFYNTQTGKWEVVGKLNESRRGIRLVFVSNTLYAMGGFNGKKYVATVERFCFETKTWSKVEDMLAARAFAGVVAVPETLFEC